MASRAGTARGANAARCPVSGGRRNRFRRRLRGGPHQTPPEQAAARAELQAHLSERVDRQCEAEREATIALLGALLDDDEKRPL